MASRKDLLVIALPDYREDNGNYNDECNVDFLFGDDDNNEFLCNTNNEVKNFFSNYRSINLNKNKSYFHIERIYEYLKKHRKGITRTIDKKYFSASNTSLTIYKILSTIGIGLILMVDDNKYMVSMPSRLNQKQKNGLLYLEKYMNNYEFDLFITKDIKNTEEAYDLSYDELLDALDIEKTKTRGMN